VAGLAGLDSDHQLLAANAALYRVWKSALISWHIARQKQAERLDAQSVSHSRVAGIEDEQKTEEAEVEAEGLPLKDEEEEEVDTQEGEWSDDRVPTFIVIDEAHNFAPQDTGSALQARVSDKIAAIAAEGRKYGLFLVLSTQRPQKLRRGLLSECENSVLLRIQSHLERTNAAEALGIPPQTIEHVSSYATGSALMNGRWVAAPVKIKCAPARTMQGGGGLDKDFWQNP
jgi:hypothetical protein